jgi:hypothetical protein
MPTKGKGHTKETVVAIAKIATAEAKVFAGEVADAAAAASATAKAAASMALDKIAGAIEAGAIRGAKAVGSESNTIGAANRAATTENVIRPKRRSNRATAKKRAAPKRRPKTKKAINKSAKKKRT